ncbi:MAG: Flp family type IVb pilin [Rhizobiaceae bacterium]
MSKLVARFAKDESGATAIEYGLIAALIALAIVTGATALGSSISDLFDRISTDLDGQVAAE